MQVRDLSGDPYPRFYRGIYKMVDDPSSDSIISWGKSNRSFVIRNKKKLIRRKMYRTLFCRTFDKFIYWLKHYGFREIKRSDGLREFGNENFVRGQPELMMEMHIKIVMDWLSERKTRI